MDKIDIQHINLNNPSNIDTTFDQAANLSLLLKKLEKAFASEVSEHNYNNNNGDTYKIHYDDNNNHIRMSEAEYSRFISDIWIGVILTLLILSIVFFICSCFLYHKFQQWKNSYRTNNTDQPDVIRRFDLDVESLPSYTLVSGLPTYDDALEQFRKAGIIISHPSIIKIFEDVTLKSGENTENADNISISSTCTCGAASTTAGTSSTPTTATISPMIELNPDQLRILSKKRLSLQIALNSSVRSVNRGRIDLCREVNRSNLLRSHDIPQVHRSTSSLSNERSIFAQRLSQAQHRGSLA